jgi:hypothetical protein
VLLNVSFRQRGANNPQRACRIDPAFNYACSITDSVLAPLVVVGTNKSATYSAAILQ